MDMREANHTIIESKNVVAEIHTIIESGRAPWK